MYVEISGRGTGKTTRLVKEVVKQVKKGKNCIIITAFPNRYMVKLLKDNISSTSCEIEVADYKHIYIYSNENKYGLCVRKVRLFYDEFAFMKPDDIAISKTGYYVTTPNKIYTSKERKNPNDYPLLKVLHANYYMYDKYVVEDEKKFENLKHNVTSGFYNREIKGEWK